MTDVTRSAVQQQAEPVRHGRLYRNRSFVLLCAGQVLSEVGSATSALAYTLLVLALTGSPLDAGFVGSVDLLARILARLPGGVLADSLDRKRLMLGCDAVRAVALFSVVAGLLLHRLPLPLLMIVVFVEGAASVIFEPAEQAALRNVVPSEQISQALAVNEARTQAASLIGSPLGGLLFGLSRLAPFVADGVSYVISFLTVAFIRDPLHEGRPQPSDRRVHGPGIVEGVTVVLRDQFLRALVIFEPLLNAAFTGALFCLILTLRRGGWSSGIVGIVYGAISVAGVVGALITPWLIKRLRPVRLVIGISWVLVAALTAAVPLVNTPLAVIPIAIPMLLAPAVNTALIGHQIAITPDRLQGRVVSVILLAAGILEFPAPAAAGALLERIPSSSVMLVFDGLMVISAIVASIHPGIRSMRSPSDPAAESS
jgi:predicted MFS family arabinose efflux permease